MKTVDEPPKTEQTHTVYIQQMHNALLKNSSGFRHLLVHQLNRCIIGRFIQINKC